MTGAVAVPVRVTVDGLPEALWVRERVADFAVVLWEPAVGLKVPVTVVAAAPGLTVRTVGLTENNPASAPVRDIAVTDSGALPVLPTVKLRLLLVVVRTFPKDREVVDRIRTGWIIAEACAEVVLLLPALSTAASFPVCLYWMRHWHTEVY
jgi:hypothetical protein